MSGTVGGGGGPAGGEGEPLVLVHGLGGTRTIWQPVLPLLAAERDVHPVDMPGFGTEPPLPGGEEPSPANLARAVHEACLRAGVERPHVAGNSLGGWVALEMGRADWAASVTALSPAGLWGGALGERPMPAREWARRLRPALGLVLRNRGLRERALSTFAAHPERVPAKAGRDLVLDWVDAEGYEAANRAMRAHHFDPAGYPAEVPVTLAWAERDRLVGPPKAAQRPPGARYLTLPECGHTPTWDDPELVARVILEGSSIRVASR